MAIQAKTEFAAEVGKYRMNEGGISLYEPELVIPLVGDTFIGRVASTLEAGLSEGRSFDFDHPGRKLPFPDFSFRGRPSYDGRKIIIPQKDYTRDIDGDHGMLLCHSPDFQLSSLTFLYLHRTQRGITRLWIPGQGSVDEAAGKDRIIDLRFPEGPERGSSLLLLGGRQREAEGTEHPTIAYPEHSYYLKVLKER